jgi:hypothetical protein
MNYRHASIGTVSFAVLTLSLLSLVLLTPITNAAPSDSTTTATPTPFFVGGEYVPVNILQLLAPFLIIAALGAAALAVLVLSRKATS